MSRVILGILFTLSASAQTPSVMVQIVEEPNVSVNHKIVPAGRDEVAIRHHALRDGLFTDFTVYGERDPQSGHLLVTVRPGDCGREVQLSKCPRPPFVPAGRTYLPLTAYLERQLIREGETIQLATIAASDGRHLEPQLRLPAAEAARAQAAADVEGAKRRFEERVAELKARTVVRPAEPAPRPQMFSWKPRDLPAKDQEFFLLNPKLTVSGKQHYRMAQRTQGQLVWISLPERGRYILSLTPRPERGFVLAGEMEYPNIRLTAGEDQIDVELLDASKAQGGPLEPMPRGVLNVYVMHDANYRPTSSRDQDKAVIGSLSPRELEVLFPAVKQ